MKENVMKENVKKEEQLPEEQLQAITGGCLQCVGKLKNASEHQNMAESSRLIAQMFMQQGQLEQAVHYHQQAKDHAANALILLHEVSTKHLFEDPSATS